MTKLKIKSPRTILILNGPNLNMLGQRDQAWYGTHTLEEIEQQCKNRAHEHGFDIDFRQSNHEGVLIDTCHEVVRQPVRGLIINPAGLGHTSVALRDALEMVDCAKIEVHLSNIYKREAFRQTSVISPVVDGVIAGLGSNGYILAIEAVIHLYRRSLDVSVKFENNTSATKRLNDDNI